MFDSKILEFDKVIKKVKEFTITSAAKDILDNIEIANNYDDVLTKINETDEAIKILVKYNDLEYINFDNVNNIIDRASKGGILNPLEILVVMNLIQTSLNINRFFNNIFNEDKLSYPNITNYNKNLNNLTKLNNLLSLAINKEGKILDQASKNLFLIRRRLQAAENKLRQALNVIMQKNVSKLNELLIVIRDNRMCLPFKIEFKNSIKGIIHDISSSNTTIYIEPEETFTLANELDKIKEEELIEINKILQELSLLIASNKDELLNNFNILTIIDVIFARAKYSKDYPKPQINKDLYFNLIQVSHPLISKDKVVPISIKMNKDDKIIIITGPNTGGKTVTLKTVGLLSLMVQSGIFPDSKKESSYAVFNNILADIGDEQSIEENLSTFSSHLTKVIKILNSELTNSLVLLDELGSGTDPKEGSALALSIIEELKKYNLKSIVTTHYTDLKNYAYETSGVLNASVEFNPKTLSPTYKVLLGIPGASCALLISKNLGLDEQIIAKANKIINSGPINSDIINYEKRLEELKNKEDLLLKKEEELNNLILNNEKTKSYIENNRLKLLKDAENKAEKIIEKAKDDAANILKELKDIQNDAEVKAYILANIKNTVNNLVVLKTNETIFNEELKVNDFVKIIPYNQVGKILAINKNKYKVNFGGFTMDFKKDDLIKTTISEPKKEVKKTKLNGYNRVSGASLSLDLRGKRYEEIKDLVEEFIDKALLANYESVNIIHGFGTGVVRNRVQELLKNNRNVKSYRYGGEGEGLNGSTVVYLK